MAVAHCDVVRTPAHLVGAPVSTANFLLLCGPVVRGRDWKWGDQDGGGDGGVGGAGILVAPLAAEEGWAYVRWLRNGELHSYRIGVNGEYDLAYADAAAFACMTSPSRCPNAGCGCASH